MEISPEDIEHLKKNTIIFCPWTDFQSAAIEIPRRNAAATFFETLFIENKLEADIEIIPDAYNKEHLRFISAINLHGWLIDMKKLKYHRIKDKLYHKLISLDINSISSYDEIEKLCEDFKHRFASKKFGI
jgi:hypothetical protein